MLPEPGQVHAHPSFSPDGRWIVFASSEAVPGQTNRTVNTRLRLVRSDGSASYDLTRATQGIGNASTYPRFAPSQQDGCPLMFITFQSRIDYGVLRRHAELSVPEWPQLWMAAIDLSKLPGDPSSPPVWLPFQNVQDKNLLPAWSEYVPCADAAACGPGATCDMARGRCIAAAP